MLFSSSPIRRRTFSCMRGNLTIRGTEYRPNSEKLPIAIVCHGFMANQQTVRQYTRVLAKNWLLCILLRLLRRQRSALGAE